MKIALTGSSGLIGSALLPRLTADGHTIVRLVRRQSSPGLNTALWDPATGAIDRQVLQGCDAVIHLAGENIGARRWSPAQKRRILDSRINGTRLMSETIADLNPRPSVYLTASAVGYYGDRGDDLLHEASANGTGFLADVCRQWEEASSLAASVGVRVVNLRFGAILSRRGGVLHRLLVPFLIGFGARLGDGRQYFSWIAIEDAVEAIRFALDHTELSGPVNVVSPEPVTNRTFTKTLGQVLARPALLAIPSWALQLSLGEMARELLLSGQRVQPAKLKSSGFVFRCPLLEAALRKELDKAESH